MGSMVSFSPAYRSAARTSTRARRSRRLSAATAPASTTRRDRARPRSRRRQGWSPPVSPATRRRPRRRAAVQHPYVGVSRIGQQPPHPRRGEGGRAVVDDHRGRAEHLSDAPPTGTPPGPERVPSAPGPSWTARCPGRPPPRGRVRPGSPADGRTRHVQRTSTPRSPAGSGASTASPSSATETTDSSRSSSCRPKGTVVGPSVPPPGSPAGGVVSAEHLVRRPDWIGAPAVPSRDVHRRPPGHPR